MSFKFNWRFFDIQDLQARCTEALTESIAQTRRPPTIVAPIRAVNIDFGTQPPKLKFHSILAVSLNRTHIVFALKYKGDATLTIETEVQANVLDEPLNDPNYPSFVRPKVLGALDGLHLPFRLMIKSIELDTLVDVVYTPDGVVVNFQEDPLKHLEVESSLDNFPFAHAMISSMLKQQLTVSFYEDIPESVWTSTSPTRQPPDPFFGSRRWSQHLKKFVRFASYFIYTFVPSTKPNIKPFDTLALNPRSTNLAPPRAILNRACLSRHTRAKEAADNFPPMEKLGKFLEESSSISSSASSLAGTGFGTEAGSEIDTGFESGVQRRSRPKRRVISLRNLPINTNFNSPSASPAPPTPRKPSPGQVRSSPKGPGYGPGYGPNGPNLRDSNSDTEESRSSSSLHDGSMHDGNIHNHNGQNRNGYSHNEGPHNDSGEIQSVQGQPQQEKLLSGYSRSYSRSSSSRRGSKNGSKHASPKYSPGPPRTPLLQSTEYAAALTDDDDDTDGFQIQAPDIPMLPSALNWEHRRFSTPEEAQPSLRQRPFNKHRTSSLQPAKPHSFDGPNLRSRSPVMPRSPGRYSSTNDLMNK